MGTLNRVLLAVCGAALLVSFGACRAQGVDFLIEARLLQTSIDRSDDAGQPNPSGTSERVSPHGEVWWRNWGLILDYQESTAGTGRYQRGNGVTEIDTEESALEAFIGHRFDVAADGKLDLYVGARDQKVEYDVFDQRSASPTPTRIAASESATEFVVGARFHHPLGPFDGHVRTDYGQSGDGHSRTLGIGLSYDLNHHVSMGAQVQWSDLDLNGQVWTDLDRRSTAWMLGVGFRF